MELQDGDGIRSPRGSRGTTNGLTDLFTHLSHIEHSANIVQRIKEYGEPYVRELLDTYTHLPQEIKEDILAYVRDPKQETVEVIKQHAANEVQRIWDVLGIC